MAYTTEGDLENLLLQDIDSSYSSWITAVIAAVEAYIDQYCGTTFADSGSSTKYYDGTGTDEIVVDEYQSITSVDVLDETGNVEQSLTADTDFWSYPLNDGVKNRLKLSQSGKLSNFPNRPRALKIVATWGRLAVPGPIRMAAAKLAAKVINEGLRGGQVKSENLGSYSITYKDIDEKAGAMEIYNILNMYRNLSL